MSAKKASPKRTMSAEHRVALAEGRRSGAAVRAYLDALGPSAKRGRKRSKESIEARLAVLRDQIPGARPLSRVSLIQERLDLERDLASHRDPDAFEAIERAFIEHAASYGERKGISYAAWREVGVPARTLRAAGISR